MGWGTLKLTVVKGPRAGETIECKTTSAINIGRVSKGNTFTIKNSEISPNHLVIKFKKGKWVISDLDSSKGTVLNEIKLQPMTDCDLRDEDVIKIGEGTTLKVEIIRSTRRSTRISRNTSVDVAIEKELDAEKGKEFDRKPISFVPDLFYNPDKYSAYYSDEHIFWEEPDDYVKDDDDNDDLDKSSSGKPRNPDLEVEIVFVNRTPQKGEPEITTQRCEARCSKLKYPRYRWVKPFKGRFAVNVDGSIKLGKKDASGKRKYKLGGYGAIARDDDGNAVAASSGVSLNPISVPYHMLEGVKKGVQLAIDNNLRDTVLICNSYYVPYLLESEAARERYRGEDRERLLAVLDEIDELVSSYKYGKIFMQFCPKGSNIAADYLAKLFKEAQISQVYASQEEMKKRISDKFGQDLNVILDEDKAGKLREWISSRG